MKSTFRTPVPFALLYLHYLNCDPDFILFAVLLIKNLLLFLYLNIGTLFVQNNFCLYWS